MYPIDVKAESDALNEKYTVDRLHIQWNTLFFQANEILIASYYETIIVALLIIPLTGGKSLYPQQQPTQSYLVDQLPAVERVGAHPGREQR